MERKYDWEGKIFQLSTTRKGKSFNLHLLFTEGQKKKIQIKNVNSLIDNNLIDLVNYNLVYRKASGTLY